MNEPESGNKYLPSKAHIPRTKFPVQWRDLVTTSVTRWDARQIQLTEPVERF